MRIDILTVEGSPRNITLDDLYNRGVGGAEKALFQLMDELSKRGHEINIFNDPNKEYRGNISFKYFSEFDFEHEDRILITFRGNHSFVNSARRKKHVGWSCDQYTMGDYREWYPLVDNMVLISDYHKFDHLSRKYVDDVSKIIVTDLGIQVEEYLEDLEKIPFTAIYCSQPDRGLNVLASYWEEIKQYIPNLKLKIFGGFSLWDGNDDTNRLREFRVNWIGKKDVEYLGKVGRRELVTAQKQAEILLYPCIYPELFNISTAECQAASCYPITSNFGAIATTNFTDGLVEGYPNNAQFRFDFMKKITDYFNHDFEERRTFGRDIKNTALKRFDWKVIADFWEENILCLK